ncbi:Protein nud1 [Elasticomyces elasticus]|nr:Protein nud1 [Elasticomyces elasticus]
MVDKLAPWLESLDEDWVAKPTPVQNGITPETRAFSPQCSSSTNKHTRSRIPRKSSGSLDTVLARASQGQSESSEVSTRKQRSALSTLSNSDRNSIVSPRASGDPLRKSYSVSSNISANSVIRRGTVEQRSKSASPAKKQETLEYKRRLLCGDTAYGDQTDLFAPSGLENLFHSPSRSPSKQKSRAKPRMHWMKRPDVMPSSPPPWPSSLAGSRQSSPKDTQEHQFLAELPEQKSDRRSEWRHQDKEQDANQERDSPVAWLHSRIEDSTETEKCIGIHESHINENIDCGDSNPDEAATEVMQGQSRSQMCAGSRTISGQSELRHEELSPVYVSKHTTMNGQIGYTALDSQLAKHIQSLAISGDEPSSQQSVHTEQANQSDEIQPSLVDQSHQLYSAGGLSFSDIPEISLPDDLPTGTPPVADLGRFVSVKRGGNSAIGSFRHRSLSPSETPSVSFTEGRALSAIRDCHERQNSDKCSATNGTLLAAQSPSTRPHTPINEESTEHLSPDKTRSPISPLKLFGDHDTFTSNRLLRRMSQLENLEPEDSLLMDGANQQAVDVKGETHATPARLFSCQTGSRVTSCSSFGEGQLNEYHFDGDFPIPLWSSDARADDASEGSPGSDTAPPGSKMPFRFHLRPSTNTEATPNLKRKLSRRSALNSARTTVDASFDGQKATFSSADITTYAKADHGAGQSNTHQAAEGKRSPSSPCKDPTPKRRRTLHASELEDHLAAVSPASHASHEQMQSALDSRRRTEAHHTSSSTVANSDTLAQRKILRPRNPTPSQRRQHSESLMARGPLEEALHEQRKLEAIHEQLESTALSEDSPTAQQAALASELVAFTMNVTKAPSQGDRKASVTTKDFLDEAERIMAHLRERRRPQSGLGNVEESDAEEQFVQFLRAENIDRSLTPLRVSRPPSREGATSGWRSRSQQLKQHMDPRAVSFMRRFEDREDMDFLKSSVRSLHLKELDEDVEEPDMSALQPLDINVIEPLQHHLRERRNSDASQPAQDSQPNSMGSHVSHPSIDSVSGRTVGTSSTYKSENVATLAPEHVAHLIPQHVAGYTYDQNTHRWVRDRSQRGSKTRRNADAYSVTTSDNDPFGDIPDLTVDEMNELHRIRPSPVHGQQPQLPEGSGVAILDLAAATEQADRPAARTASSQETLLHRPAAGGSGISRHMHSSSVPSRYSVFGSSEQKVDTRATSWSTQELARASFQPRVCDDLSVIADASPKQVAEPQDVEEQDAEEEGIEDGSVLSLVSSPTEELPPIHSLPTRVRETPSKTYFRPSVGSVYRGAARQVSLRRKTFRNPHDAYFEDKSELSLLASLPDQRVMSFSVSVSGPVAAPQRSSSEVHVPQVQSPTPGRIDATLYLSELPEFSMHQLDEKLPSEQALAKRLAFHELRDADTRYTLSVKNVVRTLTDVYPDELFWEDIKSLDLRERSLTCLHGIDDYCTRVQEMDVSDNQLSQLDGAPYSIRSLNARSNALTSLTAWGHLTNLQYVDVSYNKLESLQGFGGLVHLRELHANGNNISSLDGVKELDGLLKLCLRQNQVEEVDFTRSGLTRLAHLDVARNKIINVRGLNGLTSLRSLCLDDNVLTSFGSDTSHSQFTKLQSLSLQRNDLEELDLTSCPALRVLNIDGNRVATIRGLTIPKFLETLSMRSQRLATDNSPIDILALPIDVRFLYLSNNTIPSLSLPHTLLNLQHLELASCGLHSLPSDFGLKVPNLRTLNLNFNSLKDIRPLLNISRLGELHIAGNRLDRLRKSIAVLGKMSNLKTLDMRDNPFTLGLYAPTTTAASQAIVSTRATKQDVAEDDDSAVDVAAQQYLLPAINVDADAEHHLRLDDDTKLRRRVYEILLAGCKELEYCDGLSLDRSRIMIKDGTWEKLVRLGIVKRSASGSGDSVRSDDGMSAV